MPFFNWSASTISSAMNERFWIYWAVTGPLTLVVMGVVIAFAIIKGRQKKDDRKKARSSVGHV